MEKLMIISKQSVRIATDVKLFNHKYLEMIDGRWEEIKDVHFSVAHLEEKQIDDLYVILGISLNPKKEVSFNDETGEINLGPKVVFPKEYWFPNSIDMDLKSLSLEEKKKSSLILISDRTKDLNGPKQTFIIPVGKIDNNDAKKAINDLMSAYMNNVSFDEEVGTINYEHRADSDARQEFYSNRSSLTDEIIEVLAVSAYAPTIECEDPEKEEDIIAFISNLGFDNYHLAKMLLEKGSICYEKIYSTDLKNLIGLSEIDSKSIRKIKGVYLQGIESNERLFLKDQIITVDFYPNEEFNSYRNMLEDLYKEYKVRSDIRCSIVNSLVDGKIVPNMFEIAFIKKSFVSSIYFNIESEIDNSSEFTSFLKMLENEIINFYENLIRSNDRFRYYNFKLS